MHLHLQLEEVRPPGGGGEEEGGLAMSRSPSHQMLLRMDHQGWGWRRVLEVEVEEEALAILQCSVGAEEGMLEEV